MHAEIDLHMILFLTQHGSLFEEFVARLEGHLLQRGRVGLDGEAV